MGGVLGYLHVMSELHTPILKECSRGLSGGDVLVNNLNTNNVGIGVELELLLLDGSLHWVGGVEDIIKFLKLRDELANEGFLRFGE